jgi:UDP-GlcNAc3NAcA epimerase
MRNDGVAVMTVVGARPQFIKALPVSRALAEVGLKEMLVHTGQHYDPGMSDVFFEQLGLATPTHHLGVGSLSHGAQTGRLLERLEQVMVAERPRTVVVYGDTNSTVAGALAAVKLGIPVVHVEAGLRSFNRRMPEEINRVVTDHLSALCLAPTKTAVQHLAAEGITAGVHFVGDVMYDSIRIFREQVGTHAQAVLTRLGLAPRAFVFVTVHRAENTDDRQRWHSILEGLRRVAAAIGPVLWAVHPRARRLLGGASLPGVQLTEPLPYFETQVLAGHARVVLTDSGGLQKEAAFHGTPCVTLRDETEWVELIECGVNHLAGSDPARIVALATAARWPGSGLPAGLFGDGHSAALVARHLRDDLKEHYG